MRHRLVLVSVCCLVCVSTSRAGAAVDRPNILFILCDDPLIVSVRRTTSCDGGRTDATLIDDHVATGFVCDPSVGPFSVFAWVKGGAPGQVILSQDKGADWLMAREPGGGLATELKEPGRKGKALVSATIITDGAWHRVGLVWDGASRILYLDGVEVARDTPASLAGSTGDIALGAGSTLAPGSFWKGLIDDVRIYDRAVKP